MFFGDDLKRLGGLLVGDLQCRIIKFFVKISPLPMCAKSARSLRANKNVFDAETTFSHHINMAGLGTLCLTKHDEVQHLPFPCLDISIKSWFSPTELYGVCDIMHGHQATSGANYGKLHRHTQPKCNVNLTA